jgi:hypothetical protein
VLSREEIRQGLDTEPDTSLRASVLLSAPASDSLFRLFDADTTKDADTMAAPAPRAPTDTLAATDTTATTDTTARRPSNPFLAVPFDPLTPDADSIPFDSLGLTVGPAADSVTTASVVTSTLHDPPSHTYWFAPDSLSLWRTQVMVVDSSFFKLRARGRVDTSSTINIASLLPSRVGPRRQVTTKTFPQQVIRSPAGTYRQDYLTVWKKLQAEGLKQHYCRIFPFPLRTDWRSTSMH